MIKICVWTCDMTARSYFGKMNSTLGSVVPLAMFVTNSHKIVSNTFNWYSSIPAVDVRIVRLGKGSFQLLEDSESIKNIPQMPTNIHMIIKNIPELLNNIKLTKKRGHMKRQILKIWLVCLLAAAPVWKWYGAASFDTEFLKPLGQSRPMARKA